MKAVEFKGGPFDGEILSVVDLKEFGYYIVVSDHPERPVYRSSCCSCCAIDMEVVGYNFVGYDVVFGIQRELEDLESSDKGSSTSP